MNTDLDDLLLHAHERGEVVLYTPPDAFELIAEPEQLTVDEYTRPSNEEQL